MYRRLKPAEKISIAAMLCAVCCIIAYLCKLLPQIGGSIGYIRFTFESLPLIISGILLGPWWGLGCGIAADLISTTISSYGIGGINPIITLGEGLVGLTAGLMFNYIFKKGNLTIRLLVTTFSAHIVGNMIVKSIGLRIFYSFAYSLLVWRIPTYIIIGIIEFTIIFILSKTTKIFKDRQKQ